MNNALILVINSGSSSLKFSLYRLGQRQPLLSGLADRLAQTKSGRLRKPRRTHPASSRQPEGLTGMRAGLGGRPRAKPKNYTSGPFSGSSQDHGPLVLGQEQATITFREPDATTKLPLLPEPTHTAALNTLLTMLTERGWRDALVAVGHRVVHGGERFARSTLITPQVLTDIEACCELAPLHNPPALLGIRTAMDELPDIPHVAVLDTAFHQTMPPAAYLYALPMALYRQHGVRRYGFHGTSHRFVAQEAITLLHLDPADHGLVIAHLGNGASATAVQDGCSVDTTMGMTPLEGLVMGTRSGDVDAGAVLHIMRVKGLGLDQMDTLLNKQSGLLGLSELSNDCRELEAAAERGHTAAQTALDVFVHRLARHIGGLSTALRRLDAVIFTGGVGENSIRIRAMTLARLTTLGLTIDPIANACMTGGTGGLISPQDACPRVAVIPTNEEWMIACDTAELAHLERDRPRPEAGGRPSETNGLQNQPAFTREAITG